MTWFFLALTVLVVVGIGLISIGRVSARLEGQPPPTLFDSDEAVEFIAERLPFEVSASLSYDDVRRIMAWHLDYLEAKGVAAETEDELIEEQEAGTGPMVADDDEGLAFVLGRAGEAGLEVDDVQIAAVVEQVMAYLEAIGAIGTAVDGPAEPT